MSGHAKIFVPAIILLVAVAACKENEEDSPYDKVLNSQPFAPLTDSIREQPGNPDLYFRRAVLLNTNDLTGPALADFRKAWSLQPKEEYALGTSSLLLESAPDSALVFLRTATVVIPNSLLLQLTLARAYSSLDSIDAALTICNSLLEQNPEQVDILKMKADLLTRKGNGDEAIKILERAYSFAPADVELNYLLALKYAENKNRAVLSLTDSLIKADSLGIHAEPYYYKGIYYSAIKDQQSALHYFDLAIKHDFYFLDGYIEKGAVLYDMKKFDEALAVFNLALTVSPKFADAYYWIAKCEEATGKTAEAKLNYERAYSLDKNLIEARDAANRLK